MTTQAQRYQSTGRDFMAKAWRYLAEDDLRQASEKGWGATAQMVKCVAERRRWRHQSHPLLFTVIDRLAAEAGDRRLVALFRSASAVHFNFYEGWMSHTAVEDSLRHVSELVERLDALLDG